MSTQDGDATASDPQPNGSEGNSGREEERERSRSSQRRGERKERILHTRITEQLSEDIRVIAEDLRVPVSNLVRNVLEEAFSAAERVTDDVGDILDEVMSEAEKATRKLHRFRERHSDKEDGFRERMETASGHDQHEHGRRQFVHAADRLSDEVGHARGAHRTRQAQAAAEENQNAPRQLQRRLPVHHKCPRPHIHRNHKQKQRAGHRDARVGQSR